MQKLRTETQPVRVIDSIVCNRCEASLHNGMNYAGLIGAHIRGGYGSKIGDDFEYRFDLCETCLKELFDSFKIPALQGVDDDNSGV